jgi:ABC-type glutathione transport system ATPase component
LVAEASSSGTTVIIASHEPELVESLATRAVVMTGGRVTAERSIGIAPVASAPEPAPPVAALPDGGHQSDGPVTHVA